MKKQTLMLQSNADNLFDLVNRIILYLVLFVVVYPMLYIVAASFSDPYQVAAGKLWLWPVGFTLEGYERLIHYGEIWTGYGNTIYYTVAGTLLALAVTLPAAFALSRKDFVGRGGLMVMVMITMFFSGGLIPTYLNIKNLGLLNTRTLMIISGASSAYNLIVSRTFFSTIPEEMFEAAKIDGCSYTRTFLQIVLPLSKPIIAVMAMYFGVGHWNDYFGPMIYLKTRSYFPLQLFLREILIQSKVSAEMLADAEMAEAAAKSARISELIKYSSIIISTLPMLMIYPFLQRFFIKGVMIGAVKG